MHLKVIGVFIISISFALLFGCQTGPSRDKADLLLRNGQVWTVSPVLPTAEAVAVKGDTIIFVGSNKEAEHYLGEGTKVIDLEGGFVLPGFIDSHTHFLDGGFSLSRIQLRDAKSKRAFIEKVAQKAGELDPGEWILNGNWDHQQFDPPELPRREWIDSVSGKNPVCVNRMDGHMALANSLALKLAGITGRTPAPPGGEIVTDPLTGEPTGILKDAAMDLVFAVVPEPSDKEKLRAAKAAMVHANRHGITSIHDMAYTSVFSVYADLIEQKQHSVRLCVYVQIPGVDDFAAVRSRIPSDSAFLKFGGLKGFVDGSLGSSTALFFDPYSDDPEKTGLMHEHMFPEGILEKRIRLAEGLGLQLAVHAIGDRANHMLLDMYERVMKEYGQRDRRWRIEHVQHLLPDDLARLGELGIIASVQPYHLYDDGRWAEKKIGSKRAQTTYAFGSLKNGGACLAFGSDWTVAPLDPIMGIYAAVTRHTADGKNPGGWIPKEKITVEEAIKAYTWNGAYAEFSETTKGSLEKGKLADIVVLSRNLLEIPAEEIPEAEVMMTVFNGDVVYSK